MSTKAREATVNSETTGKIHGTGEVNGNNPNKRSPPIEKGGKISQEHSHCQRISKFPNLSPSFFSPITVFHGFRFRLRRLSHLSNATARTTTSAAATTFLQQIKNQALGNHFPLTPQTKTKTKIKIKGKARAQTKT